MADFWVLPPQPPNSGGRTIESPPNLGDLGGVKERFITSQTTSNKFNKSDFSNEFKSNLPEIYPSFTCKSVSSPIYTARLCQLY